MKNLKDLTNDERLKLVESGVLMDDSTHDLEYDENVEHIELMCEQLSNPGVSIIFDPENLSIEESSQGRYFSKYQHGIPFLTFEIQPADPEEPMFVGEVGGFWDGSLDDLMEWNTSPYIEVTDFSESLNGLLDDTLHDVYKIYKEVVARFLRPNSATLDESINRFVEQQQNNYIYDEIANKLVKCQETEEEYIDPKMINTKLYEDTFPNSTNSFPIEEPHEEANTNGTKEGMVQKNAAEAPKEYSSDNTIVNDFLKTNGWTTASTGKLGESLIEKEFGRLQEDGARYKVFYTSEGGSRQGKICKSKADAEKFAKTCKDDGCTDVKITKNGKDHKVKESTECTQELIDYVVNEVGLFSDVPVDFIREIEMDLQDRFSMGEMSIEDYKAEIADCLADYIDEEYINLVLDDDVFETIFRKCRRSID